MITDQIASGRLAAGSRLPTHRDLAEQHHVSLSVVNRVYSELHRRGFIEAGGRRGTVLKAGTPPVHSSPAIGRPGSNSDVIDLSHNYAALPELNRAITSMFVSALPRYCDDPTHARTEALVQRVGKGWLSLLSIPAGDFPVLGCWGGQHGIQACLVALAGLGQKIAVEPFTYTGLKLAASVLGVELASVDADEHGMKPDALERALAQNIKAVYLMPSFQNPLGTTMPTARRRQLAQVCTKANLFVIEDDPHRYLASKNIPSFLELVPDRAAHVTTMSKVLGPVMRLGFVATSPRLALRIQSAVRSSNWTLPLLEASVMEEALQQLIPNSISKLRTHARIRQQIARKTFKGRQIIGSLDAPHLCVRLGPNWKSSELSAVSLENGFRISAGALYAADESAESRSDFIRVSLMSEPSEQRLAEGLRRLRELMEGMPAAFLSAS